MQSPLLPDRLLSNTPMENFCKGGAMILSSRDIHLIYVYGLLIINVCLLACCLTAFSAQMGYVVP